MAEAALDDAEPVELTGTQKSAILMMLLGEDEAAEVLKNLSPREVQHLGTAMYSVQTADQETVNAVLFLDSFTGDISDRFNFLA